MGDLLILKQDIEKILNEYLDDKKKDNTTSSDIANFIKTDFKQDFTDHLNPELSIESFAGHQILTPNPHLKFIDEKLDKHKNRLNLMYYFKSDMTGLYLTLKVPYNRKLKRKYGNYYSIYLSNRSRYLREFLEENNKLKEGLVFEIDLGSSRTIQKLNKKASIVAKYYDKYNIPSDEELISDINYFLELREFLLNNYTEQIELSEDEWVSVLENKSVIDEKMFCILRLMYHMDDFSATTGQLIERRKRFGFTDEKSYNSTIVANSRRVKEFLNKNTVYNNDGTENFWLRFFYGKDVRIDKDKRAKAFQFTLKKDLIKAFARVDRTYSGEEVIINENLDDDEIIETKRVDDMVEEKLFNSFYDYLLYKEYFFDKETIENYLLSLKVKPFAILTGNSGTGKTKLSQLFSQYLKENRPLDYEGAISSINTEVLVGKSSESGGWSLNRNDIKDLIPIDDLENTYSIVVDGVPASANLKLNPRLFYKGNELRQHLEALAEEDEKQKVPLEILLDEDQKIESSDDSKYIDAKITLNKDGSAAVTKYLNNILPLKDYQGRFEGFVDDVPVTFGFNVVAYLRFGKKFISNVISPNYSPDDEIDIKIKINDIKDFISKPNFTGFTQFSSRIGVFPEHRIKNMPKEDHIKFFNIDDKLKDCEVIIDGNSTNAKFYLSDTFICLKSENADNYLEELAKRDKEDYVTIKLDLDTFKPHYPDGKESRDVSGEEFKNMKSTSNYKIIPVGANWTENRHIVGYYNVITNQYQSTPAYDLIKAANNSSEPHFLILDEMNLSHVERYFADFLSAIESGEKIPLYGEEELNLPQNLFIIGTVNVDETTYMFSPKVLDRANVIEFKTISASDYMNNKINLNPPSGNISFLESPLEGDYIRSYGIDELRELFADVSVGEESFWNLLTNEIYQFQTILKESGFDFGFRVINEIVRFMAVAWEYEGKPTDFTNWKRYFDACINQKLLPKLHGSEKIIGETLDKLYAKCVGEHLTYETANYPESTKKLKEMREVLRKQRYVSFIN